MVWEFEWSQPQAAKTLSDRVRQIDNAFGNKEVNRRAALATTEDDHFADAGRKWEELSDRLHLHTLFGPNEDKNAKVHWMISQREDALRRRRLLCPNPHFDQHLNCKYGYLERKAYEAMEQVKHQEKTKQLSTQEIQTTL